MLEIRSRFSGWPTIPGSLLSLATIDDSVERVVAELTKLIADDHVKITIAVSEGPSPASHMRPDIMKAINRITDTMWPT